METKQELSEIPENFRDWKEGRRFRAWELREKGWSQIHIAEALGVTPGAVCQWFKSVAEEGVSALRSSTAKRGPKPRLTKKDREQLPELLEQGPEAYGFRGAVWTRGRVREVIKEEFGVVYSERHVGRIMDEIDWTVQKPRERADQRDEEEITEWHEETFPELKKKAVQEERTLIFIDEAGFYLLPMAVRTYAPCGETPVLRYRYWKHVAAISAITPEGNLYTQMQESSFDGADVVRFLKHLLHHVEGKLLVVWDGLPAHRGHAVREFLRQGGAERLHLAQLPSYAPELNPDEYVWNYLKRVELKNVCCHNLQELRSELRHAIAHLSHKSDFIQAFIRHVYPSVV
jgi:transposase